MRGEETVLKRRVAAQGGGNRRRFPISSSKLDPLENLFKLKKLNLAAAGSVAISPWCGAASAASRRRNQCLEGGPPRAFPAKVRSGFASGNAKNKKTEHFRQKCAVVLRPEMRKNKKMEHFRDSKKSGNALDIAYVPVCEPRGRRHDPAHRDDLCRLAHPGRPGKHGDGEGAVARAQAG